MTTKESILARDWNNEFISGMRNRMVMSWHKYGWVSESYPNLAQALKCLKERLDLYEKTKNTEYLMDVANFAMIEFGYPSLTNTYFEGTDSDKSPGLAGGISYKQMMENYK